VFCSMVVLSAVKKERKKEACIVALHARMFCRLNQPAQWQCFALSKKKNHCCSPCAHILSPGSSCSMAVFSAVKKKNRIAASNS